jgi:hypothetical protein
LPTLAITVQGVSTLIIVDAETIGPVKDDLDCCLFIDNLFEVSYMNDYL